MSRRKADEALVRGEVFFNGAVATPGIDVLPDDIVTLNGTRLRAGGETLTIMLNKPTGYVVSRDGQGSKTIFDILPSGYQQLKPVGRLDKYSSGLLILTNDGELAHRLTHPSFRKNKVYEITLNKPLQPLHHQMINNHGIGLEDGPSKLQLERIHDGNDMQWRVSMHEGRNRQIRRTFAALGYTVTKLHRTHFGPYDLHNLNIGSYTKISS